VIGNAKSHHGNTGARRKSEKEPRINANQDLNLLFMFRVFSRVFVARSFSSFASVASFAVDFWLMAER
jgi:hypothetical protein